MLHRSHETAEVNKKIKNKTGYKITNNYLSPYLMSKVLQFVMMIVMKTGGIQIVIIYITALRLYSDNITALFRAGHSA